MSPTKECGGLGWNCLLFQTFQLLKGWRVDSWLKRNICRDKQAMIPWLRWWGKDSTYLLSLSTKKSSTKNQLPLFKKFMTLDILYKNKYDIKVGLSHFSGMRHFKGPSAEWESFWPKWSKTIRLLDLVALCLYHSGDSTPSQAENSY